MKDLKTCKIDVSMLSSEGKLDVLDKLVKIGYNKWYDSWMPDCIQEVGYFIMRTHSPYIGWNPISSWNNVDYLHMDVLTIDQLNDLVVLHRNDVNDATHSCDGMSGAAINLSGSWYGYNYNEQKWQTWDEIEDDECKISDLKPIQKPQSKQGLISGEEALEAIQQGKRVLYSGYGEQDWDTALNCNLGVFLNHDKFPDFKF